MAQGNNGVAASGSNITAQIAIEISELDRTSAASIKEKIHAVYHHHLPLNKPYCIYKVHDKFRKTNEYAYKPEIVSVKNLVARSRLSLEECLASIRSVERDVRKCYYDPFEEYLDDSKAFVELMVIDGLFIIELFYKSAGDVKTDKLRYIPCVTELKQGGVKFKRNDDAKSFLDIKFCDGKMSIPPIIIQDQTDSLIRNLIASEQAFGGQDMYITSYAFLMDSLINSPEDIAILRSENIVTNYLGDNKDVSSLFNKLCSEVTLENFYYRDLCDEVNKYASTPWHTWRASFCRDYCSNPWAGIAVFSACVLLILNFASTIFSGLSYIAPKSN
ncbi:hypothetical protein Scep_030812 [Stephania cephalantha]|uniref:Uncharacterized protein n=1 Tax=Stephania cephalantha TaxID=152367 RepID=A0AAP0E0H6_9MAGN